MKTKSQVSSGGVIARERAGRIEVALIAVGEPPRWQLPKGLVERGEAPDRTALREVREETGLTGDLVAPVDTIDYWYVGTEGAEKVRYHKTVHFFLLRYVQGDVADHDREVHEARWMDQDDALAQLAFRNERRVLERALAVLSRSR